MSLNESACNLMTREQLCDQPSETEFNAIKINYFFWFQYKIFFFQHLANFLVDLVSSCYSLRSSFLLLEVTQAISKCYIKAASCLSVINHFKFSVWYLRRRLQLYHRGHYSDPEQVVSFTARQLKRLNGLQPARKQTGRKSWGRMESKR